MARKKPIISPLGQWAYPGEVTIIPSSDITMKGVNYPVLGVDNLGNQQMMMPGQDYTFPGNYVTEYPQMQFGGMSKRKIDRILNENKDLNFVQRMYQPNTPSIMIPGQQRPSTHFMESADGRVYPTVVQMPDGTLQYLGDNAYDYADQTGQYIEFPNDRQARRFAKSYKKGTGVLEEFGKGGQMIKRKDGSYSQRGLWDNIRANKGSGKKPTKEMLEQERKIKAKMQNGGWLDQYQIGGEDIQKRLNRYMAQDNTKSYALPNGLSFNTGLKGIQNQYLNQNLPTDKLGDLSPQVLEALRNSAKNLKLDYSSSLNLPRKLGNIAYNSSYGLANPKSTKDLLTDLTYTNSFPWGNIRATTDSQQLNFKSKDSNLNIGRNVKDSKVSNQFNFNTKVLPEALTVYGTGQFNPDDLLTFKGINPLTAKANIKGNVGVRGTTKNLDYDLKGSYDPKTGLNYQGNAALRMFKDRLNVSGNATTKNQLLDDYNLNAALKLGKNLNLSAFRKNIDGEESYGTGLKANLGPVNFDLYQNNIDPQNNYGAGLNTNIGPFNLSGNVNYNSNVMRDYNIAADVDLLRSTKQNPNRGNLNLSGNYGASRDEMGIMNPSYGLNLKYTNTFEEGGWLDEFQVGGRRRPIYTSDLNDPRLQRFNDSASLHNSNFFIPNKDVFYRSNAELKKSFCKDINCYGLVRDGVKQNKKQKLEYIKGIQPTGYDNFPNKSDYNKGLSTEILFPEPVQPIIYQPSLVVSNIDRDMYTPGGGMAREYNIGVTLEDGSKKSFRTEKEYQDWKAANNLDITNAKVSEGRGYSYNYPENKKYGGWLNKYQVGGWDNWTPNVGKPYMRTSPAGNAGYSDNTRVSGPNLNNRKAAEAAQYARKVGSISQGQTKSDYEKAREASSFVSQAERRKGSADPLDYVLDIFNPAAIGFAGVDLSNNLGSAASNTVQGNFAEAGSDLLGAGLDALSIIPAAAEFKGIVKPLSKFARLTPGQYKVAQQFANNPEKAISQAVSYASKLAQSQIIKNPKLALSLQRGRPVSLDNVNTISGISYGDVSSVANFNKIKPNSISEHAFFRQLEKGVESLDNSVSKRVADLESEEGFRRLVEQEKAYLFDNTDTDLSVIDRVAKLNAKARIEELKNVKNVNKEATEYANTNFLGTGLTNPFVDDSYLYNNAYHRPASLYDQFVKSSGTLNLKKPTPNYSQSVPGEIGMGYNFVGDVPTEMHEIGHVLQRGRTLSLDNGLKNIVPKKELNPINQRNYKYFKKGSSGSEPTAFANELREAMFQKGFIPDYYSPINQQQIQDAYKYFKKNPMGVYNKNTGNFSSNTRIFDFMEPNKANSKLLTEVLNRLPAVAPLAVGAAAASQLPEQKNGGWLNNYQEGGENLPELNSKIDIANFYKNPLSEKYGIYQDPEDDTYKYYLKTKESVQPEEEYRQLPDLSNIDKQKLKEINAKKASLSEIQLSNIQPVSPVILPKQRDQILRDKLYYEQDDLMEQVISEYPIASPSYKEVLESIPEVEDSKTRVLPNKQKPAKAELDKNIKLNQVQQFYADKMYNKYGKVILTDKANNRTIYGTKKPDGTWDLNSFEVLTGQSINFNEISDSTVDDLEQLKNKRGTPIGAFSLSSADDIYGYPGLRLDNSGDIAYHVTYKGADDMTRDLLYNNNNSLDNYKSYGCINCQKPSLENLLKFVKPNDKALIINSNLGFKNNENWIKKNTPDLYNDLFKKQGGQTDWLNKYK